MVTCHRWLSQSLEPPSLQPLRSEWLNSHLIPLSGNGNVGIGQRQLDLIVKPKVVAGDGSRMFIDAAAGKAGDNTEVKGGEGTIQASGKDGINKSATLSQAGMASM